MVRVKTNRFSPLIPRQIVFSHRKIRFSEPVMCGHGGSIHFQKLVVCIAIASSHRSCNRYERPADSRACCITVTSVTFSTNLFLEHFISFKETVLFQKKICQDLLYEPLHFRCLDRLPENTRSRLRYIVIPVTQAQGTPISPVDFTPRSCAAALSCSNRRIVKKHTTMKKSFPQEYILLPLPRRGSSSRRTRRRSWTEPISNSWVYALRLPLVSRDKTVQTPAKKAQFHQKDNLLCVCLATSIRAVHIHRTSINQQYPLCLFC